MGITLTAGDEQFDVSLMGDVLPGSSDIKVEATGNQTMKLAVGTSVSLDGDVAGTYSVSMALAPAAPRGWRLYLSQAGGSAAPAATSTVSSATRSDVDNRDKVFVIRYSGAMGSQVRQSVQSIRVSYSRMSSEVARIARSGSKIVGITEVV